jgi:hypothetical protein
LRAFRVITLAALVALGVAPAAFAAGASFGLRPVASPAKLPPDVFAPFSNPTTPLEPLPKSTPGADVTPQPQATTPRPARPAPRPIAGEAAAPTPWQRSPMKLGLVAFMILSSLLAVAVVGRLLFETFFRRA